MTDAAREDDDNLDEMTVNVKLLDDSKKNTVEIPDIPFCGCLSVRFYQPYFDVDTVDITNRLSSALFFCKREQSFISLCQDKPDAYGPVWISTTLVFLIGVTSHISGFLNSWLAGTSWSYNFQSIVTASSLIYGFAAGVPAVIWLLLRQYDAKLCLVTSICVYGYSLFVYIPASASFHFDYFYLLTFS